MDRGYTWFALNNEVTDYLDLSRYLARSIKKHNKENAYRHLNRIRTQKGSMI